MLHERCLIPQRPTCRYFTFLLLLLVNVLLTTQLTTRAQTRSVPDTTNGIHIWNDQLLARAMTDQQMKFAATHYDGTQKILRSYADKFRSYNPNFLILHYRLGQALGYRIPQGDCQPTGDIISVMEGNQWVPDPLVAQKLLNALKQAAERMVGRGHQPVILCSPSLRRHLRKLTDRILHSVPILGLNEVDSVTRLQAIETVRLDLDGGDTRSLA